MNTTKLAIIGDFRKENKTHVFTDSALSHSIAFLDVSVLVSWVPTTTISPSVLSGFDGFLISPGSPYESMEGALSAIRFAREHFLPVLGTCGGFQHMTIEFARNVLGFSDAAHAETDPYASRLVVTPLSCSLVGARLAVSLVPGSMAYSFCGPSLLENYYCNFGLNPIYVSALESAGLRVAGADPSGEVRILELAEHPFFMGTLFVPQARSTFDAPHPLVTGFVKAVAARAN